MLNLSREVIKAMYSKGQMFNDTDQPTHNDAIPDVARNLVSRLFVHIKHIAEVQNIWAKV